MKASELRIGNWINAPSNDPLMPIKGDFQVEAWHLGAMVAFEKTAKRWIDWHPIPLTEEWLLKLGFEIKDLANYISIDFTTYQKGKFMIADNWEVEYDNERLILGYDLKYVHQLQNLYFALTGEELTVS